jgi:hypothetical protein
MLASMQRRGRSACVATIAAASLVFLASRAWAEDPPQLPPPPPPANTGDAPEAAPPATTPLPAEPAQPPPPQQPVRPAPPPIQLTEAPAPVHAPSTALWVGGRLGLLGFGNSFYENDRNQPETSGNFVKNGVGLEVDVGVRLKKRWVPYLGLELGLMEAGHRFDGEGARAGTSFLGVGFRYVVGDVDTAGIVGDLSFGFRTLTIRKGDERYEMTAVEILRLALGAEIRISTRFTLSPMIQLSGGRMSDTDGHITYAPGQSDGLTGPRYQSTAIPDGARQTYLVFGLGCGAHFDLFGR